MDGKKTLAHEVVCFQILDFETSRVRSRNKFKYFTEKLLLSQKTTILLSRGSRFLECFIPSTALHYSLQSKFLCQQLC